MKKVVVAMSGGVDSLVSAILLKSLGFQVHGVHMTNWDLRDEISKCTGQFDWQSVQEYCKKLNITCSSLNLVKEYWNDVFDPFLANVEKGMITNPDVECNRLIKFGRFHMMCLEMFKPDKIAFGHYAQIKTLEGKKWLANAVDNNKDQTYYLSNISSTLLESTLFPIGHLTKNMVREIATLNGFDYVTQRKESMGICFVGKRKFKSFISEYVPDIPGTFETADGTGLGKCANISSYTIGQAANIPSKANRYFVAEKKMQEGKLVVVDSKKHPLLLQESVRFRPKWITHSPPIGTTVLAKFRSRMNPVPTKLHVHANNDWIAAFETPQHSVPIGQQLVIYHENLCFGGGPII